MDPQRIAGAAIIAIWTVARVYFWRAAGQRPTATERMPLRRRVLLMLVSVVLIPIYLYYFGTLLDPFTVASPGWLGWIGDGVLAIAVGLFIWSHASLGRNWSVKVELHTDQTLVTRGPYRWVRHPMYSSLLLMGIGLVLATSNPFVSLPYLATVAIMYAERVADEERLMLESFGAQYEAYMRRTGRLLPRLRSR